MRAPLFVAALAACRPAHTGHVPRATAPIVIDGDWDEDDWSRVAARGQLRGPDGELARPSSEVRMLRDDRDLILALYAADENIEHRDGFDIVIGALAFHVDATARLAPAVPAIRAAAGYDEGTLDDPRDEDEEWVVELAIPLAFVPGPRPIAVARCDVPKDGIRRCARWSGVVSLE